MLWVRDRRQRGDSILDVRVRLPGRRRHRKCPYGTHQRGIGWELSGNRHQVESTRLVMIQVLLKDLKLDPLSSIAMYSPVRVSHSVLDVPRETRF